MLVRVLLILAVGGVSPASADPGQHTFGAELAGASLLHDASEGHGIGFGFALSYAFHPVPIVGIEANFSSFLFPPDDPESESAFDTYHAIGAGLRFHVVRLALGHLWASTRFALVSSGELFRFGLSAGLGFEFHLSWWARLGPYVRYAHIVNATEHPLGPGEAGFLQYGVRLSFFGKPPDETEEED